MMSFISYLLSGVSLGSIYAIIALGYTMVYGIAKMLNFAHGDILMVGGYAAFIALNQLGLPILVSTLLSMVICTLLGVVIEKVAYKPLRQANSLNVLITAIGVSYLLQNVALLLFGANPKSFTSFVPIKPVKLAGGALTISGETIVTILCCLIIVGGLVTFINKTKAGQVSSLIKGLLVPLTIYSIMAVSLNLVVGISGELSLGHAGFMCVGAFASATWTMLMKSSAMPPLLRFIIAILIGAAAAAVFGFLIGIPVLRLKGDYLAIVTLAFGEIIKNIINALYFGIDDHGAHFSLKDSLSLGMDGGTVIIKGAQGITGTPKQATFTIGVILLLVALFVVLNLINSRTGRAIMAIRDNRIAAESIGLNVTRYKLMAFTISAAIAGAAGVLYAHNLSSLQALPKNFGYNQSIMILVFVVMGGIGNVRGSVIAAVILTLLPEVLRGLNDYRMLMYAIVLILMMLFTSAPSLIALRQQIMARFGKKSDEGKETT